MDWTIIGTIFGGQTIIELVRWWKNRKTDGRIAETNADQAEFATISQTNLFLQQQLQEKEERFAQQTNLVRSLNVEVIQLTKEKAAIEIEFERYKAAAEIELNRVRCDDQPCPWRQPPNAYTKPKPGADKKQYHQNRKENNDDSISR